MKQLNDGDQSKITEVCIVGIMVKKVVELLVLQKSYPLTFKAVSEMEEVNEFYEIKKVYYKAVEILKAEMKKVFGKNKIKSFDFTEEYCFLVIDYFIHLYQQVI